MTYGVVVIVVISDAVDSGSMPVQRVFFFFWFGLVCFFNFFLSFFFFSFNGERSNYIISLTTEPPITLSNKQLQRNGVHANDFNIYFLKKFTRSKENQTANCF